MTTTFGEVVEGIRATIAAYTQALDDGRTDDVVATFCADGGIDIPGLGTFEGTEALREAYAGWVPRKPQRHPAELGYVIRRVPPVVRRPDPRHGSRGAPAVR